MASVLARWPVVAIEPDGPPMRIRALTRADVDPGRHPADPGTALDPVRTDAAEGGPLTLARLETSQREVLAVAIAPFRTTPAWARAGRERHGYHDEPPQEFELLSPRPPTRLEQR